MTHSFRCVILAISNRRWPKRSGSGTLPAVAFLVGFAYVETQAPGVADTHRLGSGTGVERLWARRRNAKRSWQVTPRGRGAEREWSDSVGLDRCVSGSTKEREAFLAGDAKEIKSYSVSERATKAFLAGDAKEIKN